MKIYTYVFFSKTFIVLILTFSTLNYLNSFLYMLWVRSLIASRIIQTFSENCSTPFYTTLSICVFMCFDSLYNQCVCMYVLKAQEKHIFLRVASILWTSVSIATQNNSLTFVYCTRTSQYLFSSIVLFYFHWNPKVGDTPGPRS